MAIPYVGHLQIQLNGSGMYPIADAALKAFTRHLCKLDSLTVFRFTAHLGASEVLQLPVAHLGPGPTAPPALPDSRTLGNGAQ